MSQLVTSASHPVVKRLRKLRTRKYRGQESATAVFGIQPVSHAVQAGARIDTIVVSPPLLTQSAAVAMVSDLEEAGTRVVRIAPALMRKLEERDGSAGLAAIVGYDIVATESLSIGPGDTVVALHEVANPGNLGTIMRTADATGAAGLLLVGHTADPSDPTAIKASMGAAFNVPVARIADLDTFFEWAREHGLSVASTAPAAPESLWSAVISRPVAVLFGSEGRGLGEAEIQRADTQLSIPMVGTAESLNLGVAAGVVLYELWRRRLGKPAHDH
jgi:TrmH family RNA methyltransferase